MNGLAQVSIQEERKKVSVRNLASKRVHSFFQLRKKVTREAESWQDGVKEMPMAL